MLDYQFFHSLPRPKWSTFFCVLSFCCLASLYLYVRSEITTKDLGGQLHLFLQAEHGEHPKHPPILIAGSSLSIGFHTKELERRLGLSASTIGMRGGTPLDTLSILECYPDECQYARLLFLELAPEQLTTEQDAMRKQFFDKIRGVKNTETLIGYLKRSSVPYCIRSINNFAKGWIRSQRWFGTVLSKKQEQWRVQLRRQAEQVRKNRTELRPDNLPLTLRMTQRKDGNVYKSDQIDAVYQLADLCRSQNIFLVICVTPRWYGQLNFTQEDIEGPTEDMYLSMMRELNQRPDCSVIIAQDFEQITNGSTSEGTDEDYLTDYGHMNQKGAMLYTNWLVDRLLEMPKTAAAIRQRQEQKTFPCPK
jgi:hypothetical protein